MRILALPPAARRPTLSMCVIGLLLLGLPACGAPSSDGIPDPGTVGLRNETDAGMAPLVVQQFYVALVGDPLGDTNLLSQEVPPGGVVIVGLFPAGTYNAVAVLDNGTSLIFPPTEVRAGESTNFVIPAL